MINCKRIACRLGLSMKILAQRCGTRKRNPLLSACFTVFRTRFYPFFHKGFWAFSSVLRSIRISPLSISPPLLVCLLQRHRSGRYLRSMREIMGLYSSRILARLFVGNGTCLAQKWMGFFVSGRRFPMDMPERVFVLSSAMANCTNRFTQPVHRSLSQSQRLPSVCLHDGEGLGRLPHVRWAAATPLPPLSSSAPDPAQVIFIQGQQGPGRMDPRSE